MSLESLAGLVITLMIAALLGAVIGGWIGRRRDIGLGLRLEALIEQSGKAARDDIEALRKAMIDTERVLGSKVDEGLRAGFDRALAVIADGAALQTRQIDTFRGDVVAVSRLGTELPAVLREQALAVVKALGEFQTLLEQRLGDVRTEVVRIDGDMTTTLADNQGKMAKALTENFSKLILHLDGRISEMRDGNEAKLLQIQGIVDQKLQEGIEKRMTESFAKITAQFAEVQQAVGEVKTVAGQVGDLKRLFSNVKSRRGWGEAQVKATLDDILPPGSYETNMRVSPAASDAVEFALRLPVQGGAPVYLAIDAKFPVEDYSRLLAANDAADAAAEKAARTALEGRIRTEARAIQSKYIAPPYTVEWAILYLPSEGRYGEVTRNGELMEAIHRDHRVIVMGPSMLAVMLRTIQLGHYTLAISQKADLIGKILGAVKHEMVDFGNQFRLLEKNVQALGNNIKKRRTRASVISRQLRDVAALEGPEAAALLGMPEDGTDEEDAAVEALE